MRLCLSQAAMPTAAFSANHTKVSSIYGASPVGHGRGRFFISSTKHIVPQSIAGVLKSVPTFNTREYNAKNPLRGLDLEGIYK